jgi:hypothetical protein
VFSTASSGRYLLIWTVRNAAGLPSKVPVPACSPNGDRVKDRCTWSAGRLAGWAITSFVIRGSASATRRTGGGAHSWNGTGRTPGAYTLRVLYTGAGGRALLRTFPLTLDIKRPRVADARATPTPNPFEPRPGDADRDTTTFAMNSSERGRLRAVIYRPASTSTVRVLVSGTRAAGRQRLAWNGKTSAGAWLRGTFAYVMEATDAAGNTCRSTRHHLRVL